MKSAITIFLIASSTQLLGSILPDSTLNKVISMERKIMMADEDQRADLLLEKSIVYKKSNEYDLALRELERIPLKYVADNILIEKAYNYYFNQQYNECLFALWKLPSLDSQNKDVKILHLMVLLETENWNDFKYQLSHEYTSNGLDSTDIFSQFKIPEINNHPKISLFPSIALFKYGFTNKALVNISLQLLFTGYGIYEISNAFYFIGTFSGILSSRRFYNGGRTLAKSLVVEKNYKKIEEIKTKGYSLIAPLF